MTQGKSTPLAMPVLAEMDRKGFNRNALLLVQMHLVEQAVRIYEPNDPKLIEKAANMAPTEAINQAYNRALVRLNQGDVRQLEKIGHHLKWIEGHLDRQYTKAIAKNLPLQQFAEQQGEIAKVYAGLISSADQLARQGVTSVGNSKLLTALTDKPDGALQEIHQKAMAILEAERNPAPRERMAA